MVVRVRNGAIDAIKSAAALRLFPCLCVLRCLERSEHFRNHLTAKLAKRWLFHKCQLFNRTWSSRQESGGSSACNREACCKKAVLGFPAKPCKANTAGTPSDEPKSRKLHQCEHVQCAHVRHHSPVLKARIQRAALEPFGTPFSSIFRRATKDGAPGGRTEKRMPVKTVNLKNLPPEGVPKRECR